MDLLSLALQDCDRCADGSLRHHILRHGHSHLPNLPDAQRRHAHRGAEDPGPALPAQDHLRHRPALHHAHAGTELDDGGRRPDDPNPRSRQHVHGLDYWHDVHRIGPCHRLPEQWIDRWHGYHRGLHQQVQGHLAGQRPHLRQLLHHRFLSLLLSLWRNDAGASPHGGLRPLHAADGERHARLCIQLATTERAIPYLLQKL